MNSKKQNFNSTKSLSRRFIVSGKVQGVFFRASTRKQAEQNNLTGFAKNLQNGDVEVLLQGDDEAIALVAKWLQQGPSHASVCSVTEVDATNTPQLVDFKTI